MMETQMRLHLLKISCKTTSEMLMCKKKFWNNLILNTSIWNVGCSEIGHILYIQSNTDNLLLAVWLECLLERATVKTRCRRICVHNKTYIFRFELEETMNEHMRAIIYHTRRSVANVLDKNNANCTFFLQLSKQTQLRLQRKV